MEVKFSLSVWRIVVVTLLTTVFVQFEVFGYRHDPPEHEIWFHVDGISYCYDTQTGVCRVDDANVTLNGCGTGSYEGCVTIPSSVTYEGQTYEVEELRAFD